MFVDPSAEGCIIVYQVNFCEVFQGQAQWLGKIINYDHIRAGPIAANHSQLTFIWRGVKFTPNKWIVIGTVTRYLLMRQINDRLSLKIFRTGEIFNAITLYPTMKERIIITFDLSNNLSCMPISYYSGSD